MHAAGNVGSISRFVSEYRAAFRDPRAAQKKRDQWLKGQSKHSSNRNGEARLEYAKPWKIQKKKPIQTKQETPAPASNLVAGNQNNSVQASSPIPAAAYVYQAPQPKKEPKYYNIITGECIYD